MIWISMRYIMNIQGYLIDIHIIGYYADVCIFIGCKGMLLDISEISWISNGCVCTVWVCRSFPISFITFIIAPGLIFFRYPMLFPPSLASV